ncbi:Stp1/IreP family PP2C-type Ser/Thr phosphatase [Heyndrickxia ginsengihumi]|uniref:protein-serine/threonine phosphatase n=1 Tax=Heyndrickxia ginsengihumi TaxID=363870 RepID=A0A0A6Y1M4_9BACI|nr:Stp1/IreP family PP2C-type Ser/Thr phosphatase [Heyndrickxia ginsengihumi]KHD86182.1 protein phosphatase [Heyndrickxia ginsengihumi]MBE6184416.1 Stp1/IreP family PP2C-type Ser/Thr phosphatase [Bacillus sp. (in: firmicutes)]MCM3022445.1 Stp1/IreP family PP2C-type Ser/Thr phosphatase [Heyndrickxia ginsengihumi]NEY19565.1 Stp1/IreP family PP2C-type Ser/Thr phosphatase [Heyndrickxia ginsengihumi]
MESVFRTDRGKVRQLNEDSGGIFTNQEGAQLAIVADGMGGHKAGDIASKMTVDFFKDCFERVGNFSTAEEAEEWLLEHISKANKLLFQHSQENPECEGMGTTLVAGICTDRFVTVANIGDSRCYLFNESGFHQLTEDHSLVNELVKTGQISKEDAENHPRKNVLLKALGTEPNISADIRTIIFEEGDRLLLCSDGLSNKVSVQTMEEVLEKNLPLYEKAEELVGIANSNGGEDNITIVIIAFDSNKGGCD